MPRLELTDRFVAGAKADQAPQTDYFDSKSPGLALRVSNRGRKAWSFVFTAPADGKRARMTLGSYPAMSLARARTEAKQARGHTEEGVDPRAAMKLRGAAEITVAELVNRYVADPDKARLRSIKEIKRRLDRNALPTIGTIGLAQLARRDVRDVTDRIMKRGARTQAWHTFKDLNAVLRWAVRNDFLKYNPIEGVEKPGGFTAGERTLSDDEITTLWRVLPVALAKSKACQRIIELCLITGQRLGEVAGMTRAELDLDRKLWSLPGSRTKNAYPHTVPLSDLALAQIRAALADAGDGKFVFPAEDGRALTAPVVTRAIARAHETSEERPLGRFGIAAWSAHDLRRTVLTNLAKFGVVPHT
ncbi:MAG: integrase arm-type DNA-binding domain-containing protein, partial [Pseudolabrys sp.]